MADDGAGGKVLAFPTRDQPLIEDGVDPGTTQVMTLDEALGWAWDQGFIE